MKVWMMRSTICSAVLIFALLAAGCGFTPDIIVLQPDSPVAIAQAKGKYVRLMAYSKARKKLVHVGWVPAEEYVGWTLTKYDWEDRAIRDREGETNGTDSSRAANDDRSAGP